MLLARHVLEPRHRLHRRIHLGAAEACPGFTFGEVLAGMFLLAILVPVIVEGITLANRASVVAERTATAILLAENRLQELQLSSAWTVSEQRGDFGEEWPGYSWELIKQNWELDSMLELDLEVIFQVQGREHRVRLSTLVDESES